MTVVHFTVVLLFIFLSFENYAISDLFIQSGFAVTAAFLSAVLTLTIICVCDSVEAAIRLLKDQQKKTLKKLSHPL
ncbi:hypothetical protein ACUL41_08785 [Virgibacillus natechei]|uniref:hypothetical protein n=1 Tax=Virgibacillus sp. CBA3643 TaxID=2942278 RepID=UPI0035A297ED